MEQAVPVKAVSGYKVELEEGCFHAVAEFLWLCGVTEPVKAQAMLERK